VFIELVVKVTK